MWKEKGQHRKGAESPKTKVQLLRSSVAAGELQQNLGSEQWIQKTKVGAQTKKMNISDCQELTKLFDIN